MYEDNNSVIRDSSECHNFSVICTYNIKRLEMNNPSSVVDILNKYEIDICGLQEVSGRHKLNKLFQNSNYSTVYDDLYYTYGNGLVYRTDRFTLIHSKVHVLKDHKSKKSLLHVTLKRISNNTNNNNTNNVSSDNYDASNSNYDTNVRCNTNDVNVNTIYNAVINEKIDVINIYVTHLDSRYELWRMNELMRLLSIHKSVKHILMGDFNSLTRSDYTNERWKHIESIRYIHGIEAPSSKVTDKILEEYEDTLCLFGKCGTCSHNTRIDYIFSKGVRYNHSMIILDSINESNHNPVATMVFY